MPEQSPDRLPVEVRALEAGDRAGWDVVWGAYLEHYLQDLAPALSDLLWARLTGGPEERHPQMGGLGAFLPAPAGAADRLVGIAHWIVSPSTWDARLDCYLEDLAVAPDVRGRGVGRALIEALDGVGRERGWRRLHWITDETNYRARTLYDRVGSRTAYVQYERRLDP
ncbi:acetyltransferase (GNAT) family protein [Motilibacter rhizosphaerae]|uniref:Acetyltransferase (GNAT) family protein n=1 Tax=Motilibacter rhizosphaerae TaxID=598652 RepID=A0A4Q7NSW5_9ACTN|nr:GNAT family N-acetyltransferase [Motilibacter rhizosphaerae]RZS90246.1 acetyltransferase (GNAT) family protein [Motilibacter rhizosphaerae]